jgi:RNA polymerase sigma-70 factor (ECF subfamily)
LHNIEQIIDEYGQKIYKYCYGMLRNKQEAEDATQEVFIKAYKSSELRDIANVSSWLYKVAYNHCLNVIKRNRLISFLPIKEEMKVDSSTQLTDSSENGFSEMITNVMLKLSAQNRAVLILRVVEEKSYEEIATIVNKKPDAVRKQFERVKKKVKNYIEIEKGVLTSEEASIL